MQAHVGLWLPTNLEESAFCQCHVDLNRSLLTFPICFHGTFSLFQITIAHLPPTILSALTNKRWED